MLFVVIFEGKAVLDPGGLPLPWKFRFTVVFKFKFRFIFVIVCWGISVILGYAGELVYVFALPFLVFTGVDYFCTF